MFNNRLIYNYILHVINGVVPFLLITILTHNYSIGFLGEYFFLYSVISITQLLVDYSFSFSALREYKQFQENEKGIYDRINLFLNIILSKILISTFVLILFFCLKNCINIHNSDSVFFGILIGTVLSVNNFNWFFYATQNSLKNSILLLILRLLFLIPLFELHSHYFVILLTFLPIFFSNIFLITFLIFNYRFQLKNIKFELQVLKRFSEGKSLFLNSIIISLFINSWPLVFKIYLTNEQIGLFGISDRIVRGLMSFITPIPNFILSRSKSLNHNIKINFYSKQFNLAIFFMVSLPLCFIFIPSSFLENFIGNYAVSNRKILNIYSIGFITGSINVILYTLLIFVKREIEYLYCFLFSIIFISVESLLLGISIYSPLIFDISLAIIMLINFYYKTNKHFILNIE